jgi:hypothetical protein
MEEKEAESNDLERLCQAVSPNDEPCDYPTTMHCAKCGRWFCDAHAEDEEWHPCMLPGGDKLRRNLRQGPVTRGVDIALSIRR